MKEKLIENIQTRKAKIGIIGLGYVGLPLALRFTEERFKVTGFDIDFSKVTLLNRGESYIRHVSTDLISAARNAGFQATTDFSQISDMDACLICVPTPLGRYQEPDLSCITSTMETILPHLRPGQLLSLESTTYPGTTDEVLKQRLEQQGFVMGNDLFLVYSPEREDPGRQDFNTKTTPKIVGGITPICLQIGQILYQQIVDQVVPVSSTRVAELTKLLENIHRSVNIGLVNEMKMIAERMNIDIYEVIRAASTKPFGFVPYYPGPGLGGHCIPIDPFYLTWKAKEFGLHTRFIELAGEINSAMPYYVVEKVTQALNLQCKPVNGSRILILGVAYKKNIDDLRESPALTIMDALQTKGTKLSYSDPYIPHLPQLELTCLPLTRENIEQQDAIILVADHDQFDYTFIYQHAMLIVDTRGRWANKESKIVRA